MKLIHKDGVEVQVGDEVASFRGEITRIVSFSKPHKPASSGKILTGLGEHYVSVYDLEWIDREDQ